MSARCLRCWLVWIVAALAFGGLWDLTLTAWALAFGPAADEVKRALTTGLVAALVATAGAGLYAVAGEEQR